MWGVTSEVEKGKKGRSPSRVPPGRESAACPRKDELILMLAQMPKPRRLCWTGDCGERYERGG